MNNTQAIIVYRSPAEAAFWESGLAAPLFFFMFVFFVSFLALDRVVKTKNYRSNTRAWICGVISLALGLGLTWWLVPVI